MSDLFKCGFCDFFFGLFRRTVFPRNIRGNSNTCYRELGGENTVDKQIITEGSPSEIGSDLTDSQSPTESSYIDSSCRPAPVKFTKEDDTSNSFVSSLLEDLDTSTSGPGRYEKELAKIIPKTMKVSSQTTPLTHFGSIKRKALPSKASPVVVDDSYPMQAELLLSRCDYWEFDTFHLDQITGGHTLPVLGMHLFKRYDLIRYFNLKPENCWKLFHLIEMNYHSNNPYHNSIHASDVAQAVHCFLQQPPLLQHLRKIEILVVLLAAFTHDLDHPGVNQSYLIATQHPLAVIYKDNAMGKNDRSRSPLHQNRKARLLKVLRFYKPHSSSDKPTTSKKKSGATSFLWRKKKQHVGSILECHHWRVAYGCIGESGVFEHMVVQLRSIKMMLKQLILATDITQQNSYLEQFRNFLSKKDQDMNLAEHRLMVMQIALKTADISNPGRPWGISKKWSEKVCEEFFAQGDREVKRKIPISLLCDRSANTVPSIQIGFLENIVMPLYTEWHRFLASELSCKLMQNVLHNAGMWKRQHELPNLNRGDFRHHSVPTNESLSIERLLEEEGARAPLVAPRRHSYSPKRASRVKDALQRFSGPLHALVAAPRIITEALHRGEPSARKTPLRSTEEVHRSRPVSRLEPANTVEADRSRSASRRGSRSKTRSTRNVSRGARSVSRGSSRSSSLSQERPPSPCPATRTPPRASLPSLLRSTNGVRVVVRSLADCDNSTNSDNTSSGTSAYPQQLSTVTGSSLSPSSDSRIFPATLDYSTTSAAVSCEVVGCDVLPGLIGPGLARRRGSAPVAITAPTPRRQTLHTEARTRLSASCTMMAEAMPPVRRGSLPVTTGISAL